MSVFQHLAERMGIEPEFQDAAGNMRETDPKVSQRLLDAMGYAAADEEQARAALHKLIKTQGRLTLPPVMVVHDTGGMVDVPLTLESGTGAIDWTMTQENGAQTTGRVAFGDLATLLTAEDGGMSLERRNLCLNVPDVMGYHRLEVQGDGFEPATMALIVVPDQCHVPDGLAGDAPVWGISLQLYLLRSGTNWGIGDFGDLKAFVRIAADLGASAIGLNPLHAMFPDAPEQASPYSPASRLFLNMLSIDVTAVPEFAQSRTVSAMVDAPDFQRDLAACRDAPLVDYTTVARLKLPVLEALFDAFRSSTDDQRASDFAQYRQAQGQLFERFCTFQALREYFFAQAPDLADWRRWPHEYRDAGSPAVARFAHDHRDRVDFFAWAQWVADGQLAEADAAAKAAGMTIGLYRDLAVGADSAGAETWTNPDLVIPSVHVGAPPDILNPSGQDWGLPPFNPHALRAESYLGFIELLRANMRHAGGLRIDHVMALQHLYWIPEGNSPVEGAYVTYPLDDLIGILALESRRQGCLVVGEDLGTVPKGFRERMQKAGILSYRVVIFEFDDDGGFVGPDKYPALSLATLGSHDLATLQGWWEERDIDLKDQNALYPEPGDAQDQRKERANERAALLKALKDAGIKTGKGVDASGPFSPALADAIHKFLAKTRSGLAMVQLDDLTGETDQVNVPGTIDSYPNWRRKHSLDLDGLGTDRRIRAITAILNKAR